MSFEEWYKDSCYGYPFEKEDMEDAWSAAIDEAVKVIESCGVYDSEEIYDKIKELKDKDNE